MDVISEAIQTVIGYLRDGKLELLDAAQRAEHDIRSSWGGERVYIGKTSVDALREKSRRDASIARDWQRGDHIPVLARRYGLSPRRVQQLISIQIQTRETVCLNHFAVGQQSPDNESFRQPAGPSERRRHAR